MPDRAYVDFENIGSAYSRHREIKCNTHTMLTLLSLLRSPDVNLSIVHSW